MTDAIDAKVTASLAALAVPYEIMTIDPDFADTARFCTHLDAGDEEVARVEANAEPRVAVEGVDDRRELVDRAPDRAAGTGRVLDQQPGRVGAVVEHAAQRRHRTFQARLEPGAQM